MTAQPSTTTRPAPWDFAQRWGATGFVRDLGGDVHWVEWGEDSEETPILFVHGLGGSHLNWARVGSALSEDRRAYAVDLAGFGMTAGHLRDTSVAANAALVSRFIDEVVGRPVVLIGNSMGGMVSVMVAHARPEQVTGLVLIDPALPMVLAKPDPAVTAMFAVYAMPGLGERAVRRGRLSTTPAQQVEQLMLLCFADPRRASADLAVDSTRLVTARRALPGTDAAFMRAARTMLAQLRKPRRYRRLMSEITAPVLLINGEEDRLVNVASARAIRRRLPHWDTVFFPGVGHTPQLEVPEALVAAVLPWLARIPSKAKTRAGTKTKSRTKD